MQHAILRRVRGVARHARRLVLWHGAAWLLAVVLLAALLACLTDYVFRVHEHGVRMILSASVLIVVAVSVVRFLIPALRYRPADIQVARRIEVHEPQFRDRLSSAVAFLSQDVEDPFAGSADLRKAVVSEATSQAVDVDFHDCLDARRTNRAVLCSALVVTLVGLVVFVDVALFFSGQRTYQRYPASALAVYRLVAPWNNAEWPRWNSLEIVQGPAVLARGGDLEIEVADRRGRLPDVVEIEYWPEGQRADAIKTAIMKPTADGTVVHRLENVTQPLKYRAVGGDHRTMDWVSLRLVEPPRIAEHQLRLHPPAYSGLAQRDSGPTIDALVGTRVVVRGRATKSLKAVRLHAPGIGQSADIPVIVGDDRLSFSISHEANWQVVESGNYWFELIDAEGLSSGEDSPWEIRAREDMPPTVSLEQPDANTYVVADAQPLIKGVVKDDLGVEKIEIRFLRSDDSEAGEQSELVTEFPAPSTQGERTESAVVTHPVNTPWNLAQLTGLQPGTWIDFHLDAGDFRPQWGHSSTRRLTIISRDQLDDRLAQRQAHILAQLAEALRHQRSARSQTTSLEIQLAEAGRLAKPDMDQLQSAELNQRQVARMLADGSDGLPAQIRGLLDELQSNRVDSPDVIRRMQELLQGLTSLSTDPLPRIQRDLVSALKSARERQRVEPPSDTDDVATGKLLTAAGKTQDEVIARLEALLGDLSQWDSYRRFSREIGRLRRDHQQVRQETDQLRLDTLTKKPEDLERQEKANLKRLAQRQIELARQFDKIQVRMRQMQEQLGASDPLAAQTLGDALDTARRLAVSGQMRESGRSIEQNRVGQAARQQQEVSDSLDELLDVLANRREHELERLLSQLRRSADDLTELRQQQAAVTKGMRDAAAQPNGQTDKKKLDDLSRRQKELGEQADRLSRRLERLQASDAGESTSQAAGQQQAAADSAQQSNPSAAQQQAEQAEQKLADAQRQIDEQMRQAEQDLFEEQLARMEQAIAGLVVRQESVLKTTLDLDQLRNQQNGELRRSQLATLGDLATQQRGLAGETGLLAEKIARAKAFRMGLDGAMRDMARAARGLDQRDPGSETRQAEQSALDRLKQLADALAADQGPPPGPPQQPPGGEGQQPPPMSPQDAIRLLAELKLIKLMQEQVNARTEQLDDLRAKVGSLTAQQEEEAADLAREQGQLAELVLELLKAAENAAQPPTANDSDQPDSKDNGLDDLDKVLDNELLKDL